MPAFAGMTMAGLLLYESGRVRQGQIAQNIN
jgi:hypothetical protein